jgi:hypothetical protein
MKKNAMLKVAAVVLVAVLLTTCAISSTFAKYVTNTDKKATASARVAAWGVEVSTGFESALNNLFLKSYTNGDKNVEVVAAYGDNELVAPGTKATVQFASVVTGQPEVSGKVTLLPEVTLDGWKIDGSKDYCPLVFTVDGNKYYVGMDGITTSAELAAKVAEAIATAGTQTFVAGDVLANDIESFDISWEWYLDAPTNNKPADQNDTNDTLLGNAHTATVSIEIGVKVEQTGPAVA